MGTPKGRLLDEPAGWIGIAAIVLLGPFLIPVVVAAILVGAPFYLLYAAMKEVGRSEASITLPRSAGAAGTSPPGAAASSSA